MLLKAVSGLELTERLTEVTESRAGTRAREPWTGQRERERRHKMHNVEGGGPIKHQVRHVYKIIK